MIQEFRGDEMCNQDAVRRCPVHSDRAPGHRAKRGHRTRSAVQGILRGCRSRGLSGGHRGHSRNGSRPYGCRTALHQGRSYPADTKKGWEVHTHTGTDAKARPYHVYVCKGYDPARKHPAIVSLHGGVGRPNLLPENMVNQIRAELEEDADKYGWIIIVPLGQRGAGWFDAVGGANIVAQLAAVKRRCNIDEDRVFLGGFSDGGSGALVMGLFDPMPWAGYFALSGSIVVAGMRPTTRSPPISRTGRSTPRMGESIRSILRSCRRCSLTSSKHRRPDRLDRLPCVGTR